MKNEELFLNSKKVLVGGVNSPVRAISPYPFLFLKEMEQSFLMKRENHTLTIV